MTGLILSAWISKEDTVYGNTSKVVRTTVGRVIFNTIRTELGFINFPVAKGKLGDIILETYKNVGKPRTETLDGLKRLASVLLRRRVFPSGSTI